MKKVLMFSLILLAGLGLSQVLPGALGSAYPGVSHALNILMMIGLSFIMIHVGYEFEIGGANGKELAWDYVVAMTAAAFPWIFAAIYFVFALSPRGLWGEIDLWREALLTGRFASPTSAGVLFSMLAAAGLSATWLFKKLRVLAIFDDLDTILLMIPLKILIVGFKWQLGCVILFVAICLGLAWRYRHVVAIPVRWPFVLCYSVAIAAFCEAVHVLSGYIDPHVPIHLEVLLPAFVLGAMMARPKGSDVHSDDAIEGHQEGPTESGEQLAATIIACAFMFLVGISMPLIQGSASGDAAAAVHSSVIKYEGVADSLLNEKYAFPGWTAIILHTLALTVLINVGKMFACFCYRKEADLKTRIALGVGLFPRGEVGAGVLAVSISYGIGGPELTIALMSLALNLLMTGLFIVAVKRLIGAHKAADGHIEVRGEA